MNFNGNPGSPVSGSPPSADPEAKLAAVQRQFARHFTISITGGGLISLVPKDGSRVLTAADPWDAELVAREALEARQ
jgi:hypothetical protein